METFFFKELMFQEPHMLEFYEAVWRGDMDTIEKLSIKKPIGSQVLVASQAAHSNRTPLHLAVEKNNSQVLAKLIDIMILQYTPKIEETVNFHEISAL